MLQSLKENKKGILLILISALCICSGELLWKTMGELWTAKMIIHFILGFGVSGLGGIAMIFAYREGELSVIHPMNSVSYVFSTILSVIILHEALTVTKILGILFVMVGVALIGGSNEQ